MLLTRRARDVFFSSRFCSFLSYCTDSSRSNLERGSNCSQSSSVISGVPKIKQKLGIVSVAAAYKDGKLHWTQVKKYDVKPGEGEAKHGVSAWLWRQYRCVSLKHADFFKDPRGEDARIKPCAATLWSI